VSGDAPPMLYLVGADGSAPRPIADDGSEPDWSPDGTRILYSGGWWPYSNGQASNWIYVAGADGSAPAKLTGDGLLAFAPRWSPDGSRIAYLVARDEWRSPVELYVMSADGCGQERLARAASLGFDWSPDGSQIVFVQSNRADDTATNSELMLVRVEGGAPTALTASPEWESAPRWSPDGTQIAFVRSARVDQTSASTLYVVDVGGSGERALAAQALPYSELAWVGGAVPGLVYTARGPVIDRLVGDKITRLADGSDARISAR
jgi:TolB protein